MLSFPAPKGPTVQRRWVHTADIARKPWRSLKTKRRRSSSPEGEDSRRLHHEDGFIPIVRYQFHLRAEIEEERRGIEKIDLFGPVEIDRIKQDVFMKIEAT